MFSKTSVHTGNTSYFADDETFSSLNKEKVFEWENYNIKDKRFFHIEGNYYLVNYFACAGFCPMINEYRKDICDIDKAIREYEKDFKHGNWCYLKLQSNKKELKIDMLKKLGYIA
jgi:hypothetical protein